MILPGSQSWWRGVTVSFEVVPLPSRKRENPAPCTILQAFNPNAVSSIDQREICHRFPNLVS